MELICTADEGLITVTATLQDAVLPADTAYDFNTLMLLDADDKAFAVVVLPARHALPG
ncbi:hypothetical protein O3W44_22795 [Pantoea sp. LMR881]|uniref:hypothetical protein n=1 Tax=Pantoea sp. LMR881 TaxID=3014336 RepID=UPI0022AE913D|nr:hypothetical protein [Pantoea sp. LMR881]MCZ4061363.1 hypothetical protein [Pantoea sp. LMR881]